MSQNVKVKCYNNVNKCHILLYQNVTFPFIVMLTNVSQMLEITMLRNVMKCYEMLWSVSTYPKDHYIHC